MGAVAHPQNQTEQQTELKSARVHEHPLEFETGAASIRRTHPIMVDEPAVTLVAADEPDWISGA